MLRLWQCVAGQRVAVCTTVLKCPDCGDPVRNDVKGRYGTVEKVGTKWLHVRMDAGRREKFPIHGASGFNEHVPGLRKA